MADYVPARLAYETFEPASGVSENTSPIIFLHGLSAFKEYWDDIPQTIANETKRKVYAVDSRNHGDSEWTEEFNFDMNAQDLLHFMDKMKIEKTILIGHSMGGITSMRVAVNHPEKIEKIVIEDMYAKKCPPEIFAMIDMYLNLAHNAFQKVNPELDNESAVKCILDNIRSNLPPVMREVKLGKNVGQPLSKLRRPDGTYAFKCNIDVIKRKMKEAGEVMSELEGTYVGPACFIYGTISQFNVNTEEEHIKKHFPNAELVGIEEAGHSVHSDCPAEFVAAVLKFLS